MAIRNLNIDVLPQVETDATASSEVSLYDLSLTGGSDNNYTIELDPRVGTLTVTKAPLTITADDITLSLGDDIPALTMTYDGFVLDDTASDIEAPTASTDAQSDVAGIYDIVLSGGSANNYELTLVNGVLQINEVLSAMENPAHSIQIYPNPVSQYVMISEDVEVRSLVVYDLRGQEVLAFHRPQKRFDISGLDNGVYLLKIETPEANLIKRIQKK
ncbi:MBG domain-containing protein [Reichenbachiella sp.]|uniref:MBG domain-containing protein n=1 Tax=Reichenbachiella sp. TaxID=2184521 RepID=UPI003B5BCDD1